MAEALGVAASIMAVVQISEQVISGCVQCCQYYKAVKNADKNMINIISAVTGLKGILDSLHTFLPANSGQDNPRLSHLKSIDLSLQVCEETLQELGTKLGVQIGNNSASE